ncbi:HTH_Tnp_Tc3_2 domain-containing protein [Trichonephila clavipes]|uniref:HTH_Tnp_Tc3_2 domain-containing protein n=1 Tax=Trichonephila clavipes TaxID=2585209 RepID=A0A8X6V087_TRICX|nr:HTH_Tnp_Tc3_2 domain-containing protein [Trichonephila clavipes]
MTHGCLSNRKNNKKMYLNMVYVLPSLQWLIPTVYAYSDPACATFLAGKTRSRSLPNQNALRITSGTEPTLIHEEHTTPLVSCPVFVLSASLHHIIGGQLSTGGSIQDGGRIDLLCEGVWPQLIYRSSHAVVILKGATTTLSNCCTCSLERLPSARIDTFVDSQLCTYTGDSTPLCHLSDHSSTCEVVQQLTREGTHARKTGSGATRKTTRREDRRIVRQALVDPKVTRSTIQADVGVAIVPQTISRRLAEANLKSKRPFRALPLTPEHRQLRLHWCKARMSWNVADWQKVVFSDESRLFLRTDDKRIRVWRRPGERYNHPTMFYVTLPAQLV